MKNIKGINIILENCESHYYCVTDIVDINLNSECPMLILAKHADVPHSKDVVFNFDNKPYSKLSRLALGYDIVSIEVEYKDKNKRKEWSPEWAPYYGNIWKNGSQKTFRDNSGNLVIQFVK